LISLHSLDELTAGTFLCGDRLDSSRSKKSPAASELGEIVAKHREFKQIEKDLAGAHQMFPKRKTPK